MPGTPDFERRSPPGRILWGNKAIGEGDRSGARAATLDQPVRRGLNSFTRFRPQLWTQQLWTAGEEPQESDDAPPATHRAFVPRIYVRSVLRRTGAQPSAAKRPRGHRCRPLQAD